MSSPRYPTYKKSEAGWMLDVPEHWKLLPCRGFVDERTEKNEDASCQSYLSLMANVGVIPYEEKGDVGNKKPDDLSKCKIVHQGDFVINSMNYGIGSYGVSAYEGVCSPVYIILRPKLDVVEPGFAFRVFEDKRFQAYAQSFGNGILAHRCSIGWDDLKGIAVGIPPAEEQKSILTFLDRETAKIDALIAEQERLIGLLQEKRQEVISDAVTKGLNPNAPMQDSGVEWLGEVPEHWKLIPIKRLIKYGTSISYGIVQPGEPLEEGIPFVQTTNMSKGEFRIDKLQKTTQEIAANYPRSTLKGGEVLLGIRASIGAAYIAPKWLVGANLSRGVARIEPAVEITNQFLVIYLRSTSVSNYWLLSKQGSTFNEVSIQTVKNLKICVPPIEEQKHIAIYMTEAMQRFDESLLYSTNLITLLKERRSALISAAVTGQIDVRGLVTEEDSA